MAATSHEPAAQHGSSRLVRAFSATNQTRSNAGGSRLVGHSPAASRTCRSRPTRGGGSSRPGTAHEGTSRHDAAHRRALHPVPPLELRWPYACQPHDTVQAPCLRTLMLKPRLSTMTIHRRRTVEPRGRSGLQALPRARALREMSRIGNRPPGKAIQPYIGQAARRSLVERPRQKLSTSRSRATATPEITKRVPGS
jgi:hypothetical protein